AAGQGTLAAWLSHGADPHEIAARQIAVEELRCDVDRRERLALAGADTVSEIDPEYLTAWASRPSTPNLRPLRLAAIGLVAATVTTFLLQGMGVVPPAVFLVAAAVQTAFGAWRREANQGIIRSLELAPAELIALAHLLRE